MVLVNDLTEYRKRLLFWLLDLMCEVEKLHHINKMSDTNLAIVFSPNLYNRTPKNPMASMIIASKMSGIVKAFITTRKQQLAEEARMLEYQKNSKPKIQDTTPTTTIQHQDFEEYGDDGDNDVADEHPDHNEEL
jgi:hypothetical protein